MSTVAIDGTITRDATIAINGTTVDVIVAAANVFTMSPTAIVTTANISTFHQLLHCESLVRNKPDHPFI